MRGDGVVALLVRWSVGYVVSVLPMTQVFPAGAGAGDYASPLPREALHGR